MSMASHHRVLITLAALCALLAASGCKPVEDTAKRARPDASVTPVDAGSLLEQFCSGSSGDAGCSCYSNTCDRRCGPGECQGLRIICPHGQDCLVQCEGVGACDDLVLECESGDADCALHCADGACARVRYRCNDVIGANCCLCEDSSDAFECPYATGTESCDPPMP